MICDLYGSGPFIDETMDVGTIPHQKTRQEIYDYVVSETEELTTLLKEPKRNEYGLCGSCSGLVSPGTCLSECRNMGRQE